MATHVNTYDTDMINLGDIVLDLNILELSRLIDDNGVKYCNLYLKNGHVYTVPVYFHTKLKEYCRQS